MVAVRSGIHACLQNSLNSNLRPLGPEVFFCPGARSTFNSSSPSLQLHIKEVDTLSPADFELFVAQVFEAAGWTDIRITRAGKDFAYGDGGVDIFCQKEDRRFAIEVKQRKKGSKVGVKELYQLVAGAMTRLSGTLVRKEGNGRGSQGLKLVKRLRCRT